MFRQNLIVTFALILLFSCSHDNPSRRLNTFNTQYAVADIPGQAEFFALDAHDKQLDKMISGLSRSNSFKNNRSRVTKNTYVNGKLNNQDKPFDVDAPMRCNCFLHDRILSVSMSAGFFGGFGFDVEIKENQFNLKYFEAIDDDYFKIDPTATSFTRQVQMGSKYQSLTLNTNPSFEAGQQLTGLATYTSNKFYTKGSPGLDTAYVTGKFYFTCTTRGSNN